MPKDKIQEILMRNEAKFDKNSLDFYQIFGAYFPEREDAKLDRAKLEEVLKKDNYMDKQSGRYSYEHSTFVRSETDEYFEVEKTIQPLEYDGVSSSWRTPVGTAGNAQRRTERIYKKDARVEEMRG